MSGQLRICYHGTNQEAGEAIQKEGFRVGTYFAAHLEDALTFGGPYVFEVLFPDPGDPPPWQFTIREEVPPQRIVCLARYELTVLYDDPAKRREVFNSGKGPSK